MTASMRLTKWTRQTAAVLAAGMSLLVGGCGLESEFYGAELRSFTTPAGVEDVFVAVGEGARADGLRLGDVIGVAEGVGGGNGGSYVHCWFYPGPTEDGERGAEWRGKDGRGPAILFCHGARAQIDTIGPALAPMARRAGAALMLVSYRGFGRSSEHAPSRGSTIDDAVAALMALRARPDVDPERIVVMGYSLGGVPALACAARVQVAGVIVGGTYCTAAAGLRDRNLGHLAWVMGDTGDPERNAQRILGPAPLYVFHGEADGACEVHHAYSIAAAASRAGVPVRLDIVPNAGHRSIFRDDPGLMDRLSRFVRGVTERRPEAAAKAETVP